MFNEAFTEYEDISIDNIDKSKTIINEINRIIDKKRFNHFRPANLLLSKGYSVKEFDSLTLERFEKIFIEINKLILK